MLALCYIHGARPQTTKSCLNKLEKHNFTYLQLHTEKNEEKKFHKPIEKNQKTRIKMPNKDQINANQAAINMVNTGLAILCANLRGNNNKVVFQKKISVKLFFSQILSIW
jgi:hypothetical protein